LSGNKRNKNAWRLFAFANFLSLAALPQPQPLASQARLRGLLYSAFTPFARGFRLLQLRLENLRKDKECRFLADTVVKPSTSIQPKVFFVAPTLMETKTLS